MERQPNTKADGSAFDEETVEAVWEKALPADGFRYIKKDSCGALICRENYGKTESLGWEIDHILPVAMGGGDDLDNRRAGRVRIVIDRLLRHKHPLPFASLRLRTRRGGVADSLVALDAVPVLAWPNPVSFGHAFLRVIVATATVATACSS